MQNWILFYTGAIDLSKVIAFKSCFIDGKHSIEIIFEHNSCVFNFISVQSRDKALEILQNTRKPKAA